MATGKGAKKAVKLSKPAAEKALAWHVINKIGLPRGPVIKLLEQHKVDPKIIQKLNVAFVPYGHTEEE